MKSMKKLFSLALALTMTLSMAACGSNDAGKENTPPSRIPSPASPHPSRAAAARSMTA